MDKQQDSQNYECANCAYSTDILFNWNRHISSHRHKKYVEHNIFKSELCPTCENCGKTYKTSSGLWYHQKKCTTEKPVENLDIMKNMFESFVKEIFMPMIKDNQEFCKHIISDNVKNNKELLEAIKINGSYNNNVTNSHNINTINNTNNFNLNFFLNEQCKDAININEFIESIDITFADLENTAKYGYVDGVTQIIVKRLKELDIFRRPIHCSDVKRGTLYFKHDNKWEKDLEEKPIAKHVVRAVSAKNIGKIKDWIEAHPGCTQSDSMKNRLYHKIFDNAMSGDTQEEQNNNIDKVIRNLIKEVAINKKSVC
jgi:Zinc finger, C2H2 type